MSLPVAVLLESGPALADVLPGQAAGAAVRTAAAGIVRSLGLPVEPVVETGPPLADPGAPGYRLRIAGAPARLLGAAVAPEAAAFEARLHFDLVRNADLFVTPHVVDALRTEWSGGVGLAALSREASGALLRECVLLGCSAGRLLGAEAEGDERDPPAWRLLESALESELTLRLAVPPALAGPEPAALAESLRQTVFNDSGVYLPPCALDVRDTGGLVGVRARDVECAVPAGAGASDEAKLAAALEPWLPAFVTRETTLARIAAMERSHPLLVGGVRERFGDAFLTRTCRALVAEGVGILDFRAVLGGLLEIREPTTADEKRLIVFHSPAGTPPPELALRDGRLDPEDAADCVRRWARRRVTTRRWEAGSLRVLLLDVDLEDAFRAGTVLPGTDTHRRFLVELVGRTEPILTNVDVRRRVFEALAVERPDVPVLCYQELLPETRITPAARISID